MSNKAPVGSVVKIYVDLLERVSLGDVIQTGTGRRYLVVSVREQSRGNHIGRQHLRCAVLSAEDKVPGKVHEIIWYRRSPASKRARNAFSPR